MKLGANEFGQDLLVRRRLLVGYNENLSRLLVAFDVREAACDGQMGLRLIPRLVDVVLQVDFSQVGPVRSIGGYSAQAIEDSPAGS